MVVDEKVFRFRCHILLFCFWPSTANIILIAWHGLWLTQSFFEWNLVTNPRMASYYNFPAIIDSLLQLFPVFTSWCNSSCLRFLLQLLTEPFKTPHEIYNRDCVYNLRKTIQIPLSAASFDSSVVTITRPRDWDDAFQLHVIWLGLHLLKCVRTSTSFLIHVMPLVIITNIRISPRKGF